MSLFPLLPGRKTHVTIRHGIFIDVLHMAGLLWEEWLRM